MNKNIIFFLITLVALQSCSSSKSVNQVNKEENSLLWKVSGKNLPKPSYIFGTFHMMCKEDIVFSEGLKKALSNSQLVYFELDLDDAAGSMSMMKEMKMKNGKTLQEVFSDNDYKRVEKFFKDSLSMSISSFKQYKPFFLVSLLYPKLMTCAKASGVEQELMKLVKENKKEIKGLESYAFQASVFDSIPYELQAKEVLNMMDSMSMYKGYMVTMVNAYKNRKLSILKEMTDKTEFGGGGNSQELLLDGRNRNWVQQMKKIFPANNVFIAVGAGHLIGESGLISLLRKEGYKVEAVLN